MSDLTKGWRTNEEQTTVDRLNAEIDRLKAEIRELKQLLQQYEINW